MTSTDQRWMTLALKEGRRARVWSAPNPAVGCAIVRDDTLLSSGFTHPPGQAHAEVHALSQTRDAAGATVYVTLEPCNHTGMTPPCVDALIDAGVARVVIACIDPDPRVSGKGIERLKAAGIEVVQGVCEFEAQQDLSGFFMRLERGWGRVTVKVGASADGRTAMASGESQWITGVDARSDVQAWRASSDVIVTGSGTVAADDCALTVRPCDNRFDSDDWSRALTAPSLRAVIDSRGMTPPLAQVVTGDVPTLIFTEDATSLDVAMPSTVTQVKVSTNDGGLDLRQILRMLGERGANEILIEAGPTLVGALERQNLIDQWLIYMAPVMLGPDARPLHSAHFSSLAHAHRYAIVSHDMIGDDLRIIMRPATGD